MIESVVIGFLLVGVVSVGNLIKDSDFQNYHPTVQAAYTNQIVYMANYLPNGSWYGNPTFQIKNFTNNPLPGGQNRLDIITNYSNYRTCQDIALENGKTYYFEF